jgi:hypothetical protein
VTGGRRRIVLVRVVVAADDDDELHGPEPDVVADPSAHDAEIASQVAWTVLSLGELGPIALVGATAYYVTDANPL